MTLRNPELHARNDDNHQPIFMTLGAMTDADKVMNPQHFWERPGRHPDPNPDYSRNLDSDSNSG